MIEFEGVSYAYPRGVVAVRDVNLRVARGEFVGVIGHSGAGKTTLVKLASGILKPTAGRVLVDGNDTREVPLSILAKKVGYVYQNPEVMLFSATILDEVAFALMNFEYPLSEVEGRVKEALKRVDLNKPLSTSPHTLSFGEKHRLAIACVLAMEPEAIILDEPTTGLDYARCLTLFETLHELNRQGVAVVVITHDTDLLARYARRVLVLEEGRVVRDGLPSDVLRDVEFLEKHRFIPTQLQVLASKPGCSPTPEAVAKALASVRGHCAARLAYASGCELSREGCDATL